MKYDNNEDNASISSWKTINIENDINEFKNNVNKFTLERIEEGVCGKKYKLKLQDKCFFKKQFVDNNGYLAEQALSGAFISCFSHTPYPVGKTYDDKGQSFLVWRYDDCQKNYDEENEIFFNYKDIENEYNNDKELKSKFCKMTEKMQKYAIMLNIHQFFFNLCDRKPDNLILTNNKLIHIDLDRCFFFFSTDGSTFKYKDKFCNLYESLSKENNKLIQWRNETISKIKNIDYDVFIKRYIRNCIVFNIPCKIALKTLKTFITKMKKFNVENYILNQISNNQWLSSLQKACKEFYSSFLKNNLVVDISSGNFDKKFEELFQQAQNSYVISENKYSENNNSNKQDKDRKNNKNNSSKDNINNSRESNKENTEDLLKNSQKSHNNNQNIPNTQYQSNQIDNNKGTEIDENVQNKRDINTAFEDENNNPIGSQNEPASSSLCPCCFSKCWPFN